jgi:thiosulfate/3-mercaptopyruvate sulfurtransferase
MNQVIKQLSKILTLMLAVTLAGLVIYAQGHGGRRGGGMGQRGPQMQDMQTIHTLFDEHKKITRTVKNIRNGVETVTESDDPKVQALIAEHVWAMEKRLKNKQPIRMWDPLFVELFKYSGKINMQITKTAKGVKVTETSDDPYVVKLIQSHAQGVSEFVKEGPPSMHKRHELPDFNAAQSITNAEPEIREEMLVSTSWLAEHLTDKNLTVLHISRERKSYDEGHAPGARFIALGDILAARDGVPNELPAVERLQKVIADLGIGNEGRIVIYGDNNGLSAARLYYTLDYLGHGDRAALLDGGLEKWKAERRPIETQPAKYTAATFTPRLHPKIVIELDAMRDLSWVAANVSDPDVTIIDARPEDQYVGTPNQRSGHIPGAANIYWMKHLKSAGDLTMKPAEELRKIYYEAGIKPGQKVVSYCNTGVQASHSYFTLKYLGYDVMMYDASFSEWSKVEGAPVVTGKGRK